MKVREIMSKNVIRIRPEEPVAVAARALEHYNIGAMPVCGSDGRICGVVTDRDLVTRCLASDRSSESTTVADVMTSQVYSVSPDTDARAAAEMMGQHQVRRLPVLENGRLCGMVSLGDLAVREETGREASEAFGQVVSTLSSRK